MECASPPNQLPSSLGNASTILAAEIDSAWLERHFLHSAADSFGDPGHAEGLFRNFHSRRSEDVLAGRTAIQLM